MCYLAPLSLPTYRGFTPLYGLYGDMPPGRVQV